MELKKVISLLIVVLLLVGSITGCSEGTKPENLPAVSENGSENPNQAPEEIKEPEFIEEEIAAMTFAENTLFITGRKINVRDDIVKDAKILGSLSKGSQVVFLEEKKDEKEETWYKVTYEDESGKEVTGWISSKNAAREWTGLIGEKFRDMDYTPQKKIKEYENNPRVKVRGLYVTIYSASNARIDSLIEMAKRTNINAFVIDVKDDKGYMLFPTKAAEKFSPKANEKATVKDIQALMKKLKDNNIYAIARIVSFKDPTYTTQNPDKAIIYKDTGKPFMNKDGLIWASPHDRILWEYNLEVSKEAADAGFNEIQFDYVRFPASDGGKLDKHLDYRNESGESKPGTIQNYLKYAREQLSPKKVYISADVYGLVGSVEDDMSLGQYWEAVSNIVDYICPMMYPSHYANNTYGVPVPDADPYKTVYNSAKDSAIRNKNMTTPAIIRPWIQDFTAPWVKGYIKYGDKQVIEQIKALEENGIDEFLLWNAGNKYSEGAVAK
ncbi:putative glycoside hydrolase [Lutispora sp.]|uniref:putative glycoside hydrolase n=1 Tax=Lutispora sp. TaxID=2828727 RepID=UPI002B21CDF1|nr:putative glycoside hydrolase [Lutispora sp.]MEA4960868.1 putative glycoside hydrolase [Lutispora sp.]